MPMIRASIVVVSYNSYTYLTDCLGSICAQLGPHDELIVVDNASTDGSAALVSARFPQARLLHAPNDGYAGGNNRGAALATGSYLMFLNPDTQLESGALNALLLPFADPAVGLTTACVVHTTCPDRVNTCGNTVHVSGLTYCRGAGQPRANYGTPVELAAVSGAAFAIRRALFVELAGFDANFFLYLEDTDLSWRARLAGARCVYTPDAVVRHDYRLAMSPRKAFFLERNRHVLLLKCLSRSAYLCVLPALLLAELLTWGFMLIQGPPYWLVKLQVYAWLLANRATIWRARSAAQALRRCDERTLLAGLSHRLDFGQLADARLARLVGLLVHPLFWLARAFMLGQAARHPGIPHDALWHSQ